MFDWLKKKKTAPEGAVEALAQRWFGPQALAGALAETVRDFVDDVNSGRVEYPAHKRRNDSAVGIWRDLRLEALSLMFNFGNSDPMLLADQRRQGELLRCLLDERPHLELPQPRGEIVPDTLQAVWQVYLYLDKVGSEVADRETDRATLDVAKKDIFDGLTARAEQLRVDWEAFEGAIRNKSTTDLPEMPKTLLEEVYQDVTAKTKSIALSAQFGPIYEATLKMLEEEVRKDGGDAERMRVSAQRLMAAKDPDEYAQT